MSDVVYMDGIIRDPVCLCGEECSSACWHTGFPCTRCGCERFDDEGER